MSQFKRKRDCDQNHNDDSNLVLRTVSTGANQGREYFCCSKCTQFIKFKNNENLGECDHSDNNNFEIKVCNNGVNAGREYYCCNKCHGFIKFISPINQSNQSESNASINPAYKNLYEDLSKKMNSFMLDYFTKLNERNNNK